MTARADFVAWLAGLSVADIDELVADLPFELARAVDAHWPSWAHPGQTEPAGDWRSWIIMAGRGFGKTRAGAQWVLEQVEDGGPIRVALVAATLNEARQVMVEGASGLLAVAAPWIARWSPSLGRLRFRNGAEAALFSGASPDLLRGPEHDIAWCDELAKWEQPLASWDMLQLGLRRGARPRALITTTPRGGAALTRIIAEPGTIVSGGPTYRNPHLPAAFRAAITALYAGTRLGRQEIEGQLITAAPGALWTVEMLAQCRAAPGPPPRFVAVVIGVDPPSGDGTCGIIACARDGAGHAHVLADHSVSACSPERWANAVADAAAVHALAGIDGDDAGEGEGRGEGAALAGGGGPSVLVVAERNQGGKMVQSVLHTADPRLRVKLVHAHHGKAVRAEPVALLFEAGQVTLRGRFPALEAELLGLIAGGGYDGPGASPDRADAMVWALRELKPPPAPAPRMRLL